MSLPLRVKLGWGLGSLGSATLLNAISATQLYFFVSILGINAAVAGSLILVSKLYDLATDPPMGMISDRTRSAWGRRRPWMFAGAFVCGAAFIGIYNVPATVDGNALIAIQFALLLAYATGYTMFNVPYLAMPAEMTDDFHDRSKLMSFRVVFASLGIVTGSVLALQLITTGGGGREGYASMSFVVGAIIVAAMLGCVYATRDAPRAERDQVAPRLSEQLRALAANRPFIVLATTKLLQLIGVAASTATLLFLIKAVLGRTEGYLAIWFGLPSLVGTLLSMPLWLALARATSKRTAYITGALFFSGVALTWLLSTPQEPTAIFALRGLAYGVGTGGVLLMGQSMLPDIMEYDRRRTGARREGIYSGAYSLVEKLAFAVAPFIIGVLLAAFGYDRSAAEQGAQAQSAIYFGASVLPALAFTLSVPVLLFYDLSEARLRAASQES